MILTKVEIYGYFIGKHQVSLWVGFTSAALVALCYLSGRFDYLTPVLERPTYLAVTLMCAAGASYLLLVKQFIYSKSKIPIFPLFIVGLALRLLFIPSTPIHEDDFHRYFFDGGITLHGVNPYIYAPEDALSIFPNADNQLIGLTENTKLPSPELSFIYDQYTSEIERIAYPHVRTIYPPVAQSVFALAYAIEPFNLWVWRTVLVVFEIVSFILLINILRHMHKPIIFSAIYWLNPLLITETVNAAHMDTLLTPFILFALLMAIKRRFTLSGIGLAFAVGVKVWPILLVPYLFRPLLNTPKKLIIAVLPCLLLSVLMLMPQLLSYANEQSGLSNYSQYWRTNSFLFGLIEDSLLFIEQRFELYWGNPQEMARFTVIVLLAAVMINQFKQKWQSPEQLAYGWLIIIASMFFLSPTGYPWYFIWMLPLIAVRPSFPLLSLTLLLPLYDLRYPLAELGMQGLYNNLVIPFQFLLPIGLMFISLYYKRVSQAKRST